MSAKRGPKKKPVVSKKHSDSSGPSTSKGPKPTEVSKVKCNNCHLSLHGYFNESNLFRETDFYPKCSRCKYQFHWECTELKHEEIWLYLYDSKEQWKCCQCTEFPASESDILMQQRIQHIQLSELFLFIKDKIQKDREIQE